MNNPKLPPAWKRINGDSVDAISIGKWFFQVDDTRQDECIALVNAAIQQSRPEQPVSDQRGGARETAISDCVRYLRTCAYGARSVGDTRRADIYDGIATSMSECVRAATQRVRKPAWEDAEICAWCGGGPATVCQTCASGEGTKLEQVQTSGPQCKKCGAFTTKTRVESHGMCMKCESEAKQK